MLAPITGRPNLAQAPVAKLLIDEFVGPEQSECDDFVAALLSYAYDDVRPGVAGAVTARLVPETADGPAAMLRFPPSSRDSTRWLGFGACSGSSRHTSAARSNGRLLSQS